MAVAALAPPVEQRPRVLVIGAVFGSVATAMVVLGLLGVYLNERAAVVANGGTWLPDGVELALTQPNVMLFGLIMASVTMQWAVSAVRDNDNVNSYLALGLTFLFGLGYVNMMIYFLGNAGLDLDDNLPSLLILTVSGAHLLMTVVAMVLLALMSFRVLAGGYNSAHYDGITASAIFWHVMVAVYAVLWIAIYVTK
jgi:heme/copper-type cytochrome/quinol oxidase subunit 3